MISVLMAPGCMSFNGKELPRREVSPIPTDRPIIALEVGEVTLLLNGQSSVMKPAMSASSIGGTELAQTLRFWKSHGLIENWGRPGQLSQEPRYKLSVTGTQNEETSMFAAFVTGFTMFLFPSSTTLRYDWRFGLTDLRSGTTYEVPVKRSLTMWTHIVFLPALPLMPVGTYRSQRDQALYVYTELAKQGAWAGLDSKRGADASSASSGNQMH